jgi:hypothetical protein
MSLPDDLRRQAWHLARLDRGRPSQASLRRAVSAAYYSLFHLLIGEATRVMLGSRTDRRVFRQIIARGFSHGSMVACCKSFAGGTLPQSISSVLPTLPVPPDLTEVAGVFVRLQEERHRADYNLAASFQRTEVVDLLTDLDGAVGAWRRIRSHETARFFLAALPLWEQLRR